MQPTTIIIGALRSTLRPWVFAPRHPTARHTRSECGFKSGATTTIEYKTNGEPWYGHETVTAERRMTGALASTMGASAGNDYTTGDGIGMPASFNSSPCAISALSVETWHRIDGSMSIIFRLDQTGVELPGQAFDIDDLVTDGIELTFASLDQAFFDKTELELWYNRTKFNGDAQHPGKRRIFVIYGPKYLNFSGTTDVDSTVAGFTWATTSAQDRLYQMSLGVDTRYVEQELNEITNGTISQNNLWRNAKFADSAVLFGQPGALLGIHGSHLLSADACVRGVRTDWVATNIKELPSEKVGTSKEPYEDIVGTDRLRARISASWVRSPVSSTISTLAQLQGGSWLCRTRPRAHATVRGGNIHVPAAERAKHRHG